MAARAQSRTAIASGSRIDLPAGSRPQIVNELGFEITRTGILSHGLDGIDGNEPEAEGKVDAEDAGVIVGGQGEGEELQQGEPLLSMAERWVCYPCLASAY
jgi:hypothetical protein